MIIEEDVTKPTPHKVEYKKYHVDLSEDKQIKELSEKYEGTEDQRPLAKIDEVDFTKILERYANDPKMDLFTVAETFHISARQLNTLLKNEKYHDLYQAYKKRKGALIMQEGYAAACRPLDNIDNGLDVSLMELKACDLKSKYCLQFAQALDPDLKPSYEKGEGSGAINVVVNTGFKLNI